jgi:hypothetical protein
MSSGVYALAGDHVEAFGMSDRKRTKEKGVDEAEGGGAGAEGESEGEDGRRGGDFAFAELAEAEQGVGTERVEPAEEFGVAARFAVAER